MAAPRGTTALLALAGLLAACAAATGAPPAPAATSARQCITPAPADLQALREDRQRLVVVVKAFDPGEPEHGGLVVSLIAGDPPAPRELTRVAIHPLQPFKASQPQRSQRFLVSVAGFAHLLPEGRPVCLEVRSDAGPSAGQTRASRAEIAIERAPITRP
ncbi:hypothetical protein M5C99_10565 [Acidovorax sp. NCPPB 2350]|nr:hypothetical protein M5C99_10565 [Acidovorax sp. NCPPB 2350]